MADETVEVRLLGPLDIRTSDGVAVPAGPRQRAVLAVLALARGQIVSVDRLAECVWGAELPRNHANAVQILGVPPA